MKVLIVYAGNKGETPMSPFVKEQHDSLIKLGLIIDDFQIIGNGIKGYLRNLPKYRKKIKLFKPDIVHAHYGISGLFANLQRLTPVVVTYHGSDINIRKIRVISKVSILLSKYNIFVSNKLLKKVNTKKSCVIPCGIDSSLFYPINKEIARKKLGLDKDKKYILFSSTRTNPIKNFKLAKESIELLNNKNIEIIDLWGYTRIETNLLFNAVDIALMTSLSEGSPQFIKEAMACNCPIISTDVGDVKDNILHIDNCFIANDKETIANNIKEIIENNCRSNGSEKISKFDNKIIANKIFEVYKNVLFHN